MNKYQTPINLKKPKEKIIIERWIVARKEKSAWGKLIFSPNLSGNFPSLQKEDAVMNIALYFKMPYTFWIKKVQKRQIKDTKIIFLHLGAWGKLESN